MEKFCIVKRRKQGIQGPFLFPLPIPEEEPGSRNNGFNPESKFHPWKKQSFSLELTPNQSRTIRSGEINLLGAETTKSLNLDLHQEEDGSIIFNFHLDLDHNLMMLKPGQVCRMLQISRHLLNRMVKENKIKSYKFGRLRRFSLTDISEALGQASH
jgi:excisionase family DNA binding protein